MTWEEPNYFNSGMPRKKNGFMLLFIYRLIRIVAIVFGNRRVLKVLLRAHWVIKRSAWALSTFEKDLEFVSNTQSVDRSLLSRVLKPGDKVLDLACGFGRLSIIAMELGCEVYGVDLDLTAVQTLRQNHPEGTWIQGNILDFEPSVKPDWVILSNILEHLDEDLAFLIRIKEMTKNIVVEVPDFESDPLNYSASTYGVRWYSDADHVREYNLSSLQILMAKAGWAITESISRGHSIGVIARLSE